MTNLRIGIVFAALAVILGALGAHALETSLNESQLASFLTGVRYQMYHAIALIVLGVFGMQTQASTKLVGSLFTLGIIFFSGSIYGLTLLPLINISQSWLGPITPIGGLILIAAWTYWLRITYILKKTSVSGS